MDNYKYYSGSMSYDFDMFMPRATKQSTVAVPRKKGTVIKYPAAQKRTVQKTKAKAGSRPISVLVYTAIILLMLCANIFTRAEVTEMRSQINTVKTEIGVLESEKTRLECELGDKISYANLEKEAEKLGMKKMDKSQIKYIKTNKINIALDKNGNVLD